MQIETGMYIFQHHAIMSEMLGHAKVFRSHQGMNDIKSISNQIKQDLKDFQFHRPGCAINNKS